MHLSDMKDLSNPLTLLTIALASTEAVMAARTPSSSPNSTPQPKGRSEARLNSRSPGSISIPLKKSRKTKIVKRQDSPGNDELFDGGVDYEYQGTVGFGTPSQTFEIQFDTGSSILMCFGNEFLDQRNLPTKGVQRGPGFDSTKSSTYSRVGNPTQQITYAYGDSTQFTADIVQDTVVLGGYILENAVWAEAISGNFSTPGNDVSGILGLAFTSENLGDSVAASYTVPPIETLWQLGALQEPVFSFALVTNEGVLGLTSQDESVGGVFTLGKTDNSLFTGDISYAPLVTNSLYSTTYPSSWSSTISSFTSNGNLIQGSSMDILFDTGSAISSLPPDLIQNIFASVDSSQYAVITDTDGVAYVQCEEGQSDPINLSIQFGGSSFDWPFENLIDHRVKSSDGKTLCAFGPSSSTDSLIIGADFLKSVFSIFRFDPPSIGLAKLSSAMTSKTPSDTGAFTQISETVRANVGAGVAVESTPMADYTTEVQLTATGTSALVQPTTQTLPLTPTFIGTTTLNSVNVQTSIGEGGSSAASKLGTGGLEVFALGVTYALAALIL